MHAKLKKRSFKNQSKTVKPCLEKELTESFFFFSHRKLFIDNKIIDEISTRSICFLNFFMSYVKIGRDKKCFATADAFSCICVNAVDTESERTWFSQLL